jgi:hypothetical protein
MAASTITIKLSPSEYGKMKRWLQELMDIKYAKTKRATPFTVDPPDLKETQELRVDITSMKDFLAQI